MKKIRFAIKSLLIIWLIIICNSTAWSLNSINTLKSGAGTIIDLKSDAIISGANIKVSDVARVKGKDIDLSLTIDKMVLGRAPWPGHIRTFDLGEIKTLLYNRGVNLSLIQFEGANEVTVKVKSIVIYGEEIANHAARYLRDKLNDGKEDEVELSLQQIPDDLVVPLGNGDVKLRFSRASMGKSKKQVYLSINIVVDGNVYTTVGLTLNIKRFGNVVVAKRAIRSGQIIQSDAVSRESVETTQLFEDTFSNIDDVTGKIAKKSFRPGQIITKKIVKNMSAVRKGDNVVILIKSFGLTVTARGVCKEDGAHGDRVKVVNVDTKKVLFGNVLDSGTVEVQS